ncbi:hypothetical protein RND81_03G137100 [Saponaria officinalis]|uniref:DNA-directed RNA polymerase subunit beta n=2 Tax=Saponaria officinalis TaxID=3572 RepID=A0AAW1M031_SAPOF
MSTTTSSELKKRSKMAETPDFSALRQLFLPHIESYDYLIDSGLETIMSNVKPVEIHDSLTGTKLRIYVSNPTVHPPLKDVNGMSKALLPHECRQAKITYSGRFMADVCFQYNDGAVIRDSFYFGQFPVMLMSKICNLRNASPAKLVSYKEEQAEMGGYFVCNGLERVVRLLIMQKRNHPMSMVRSSFRARREGYSDKAVVIRCVGEDQSSVTVKLYYLNNGSARLGFWIRGREFLLPVGVVLKALIDTTDHELYVALTCAYNEKYEGTKGAVGTQLVGERAKIILDELHSLSLLTRRQCLEHIGEHFQPVMDGVEKESYLVVGETVLNDFVFVHLGSNNHDKFNLLIFMLQKLFSLVDQTSVLDNSDSLQNHEVLPAGQLISIYLKDRLQEWLNRIKRLLADEIKTKGEKFLLSNIGDVKKLLKKNEPKQISAAIENLLKTGRLASESPLDLPQRAGFAIQADKISYVRFLSHFRSVHRGTAFAGARTTSVRKLLPEAWGFLCPVHTPDGEPCGLLNHLTCTCRITSFFDQHGAVKDFFNMRLSIINTLFKLGMKSSLPKLVQGGPPEVLSVLLDGRVIGAISAHIVEKAVSHLRKLKLSGGAEVPCDMEVGYVPLSFGGAYPGLFLFTNPSRFIRPVRNVTVASEDGNDIELISPFEQVFMEIRCPDGGDSGRRNGLPATHEEIHPTGILSVVANLTPWSNHNQSPRNMYQCQMAKQTMGFSAQAIKFRSDQKAYHLQTPQSPIVRTKTYTKYCLDEYPSGTNAIVAVLAYTGYDMEDAMILNKSSVDRGMCHAQVYQTDTIDLTDDRRLDHGGKTFRRSNVDRSADSLIDVDGLPYIGQMIHPGEPYCGVINNTNDVHSTHKLKGSEPAVVDYVAIDGKNKKGLQKVNIRLRRPRNPIIGDKFSSRHGQKGVCSRLWPDIDMPFSEITGMRPDLIINPHAFPSRMTIAMLLESIAAKGGSLNGKFVDATPFENSLKKGESGSESPSLVEDLGSMLTAHGFNKFGTEVLYSGVYGTELTCEIFIGPVYYQRLRHMVSDKFQVRSTGTVDQVTRQPIKGRKRGGGVRFGEMERDAMLAHGAAYLLHDRLHKSSDYHVADVCSLCGSVLSSTMVEPHKIAVQKIGGLPPARAPKKVFCHSCQTSKGMETVAMPYVFRYLAAELAAMNIKMFLELSDAAGA